MQKYINLKNVSIVFGIIALVLIILWLTRIVTKIDTALISGVLSLVASIIDFLNKNNISNHSGTSYNIESNKKNIQSHAGAGDIIGGDKRDQKHTGSGHNIGTMINNNNYKLSDF